MKSPVNTLLTGILGWWGGGGQNNFQRKKGKKFGFRVEIYRTNIGTVRVYTNIAGHVVRYLRDLISD